jgi:hypothetical protein
MRSALLVLFASLAACSSSIDNTGKDAGNTNNDSGTTNNDSGTTTGPSAATVSLESQCPSFTPCGGSVEGTWDYTGGCAELDLSQLQQACSGITVSDTSATVTARVVFAAGQVHRTYTATGKATLHVPSVCAQPAGGCTVLQSEIQSGGNTATCSDDGSGGCNCNITATTNDDASTSYSVQGNTVVTGDGNQYDFCVNGGSMTYRHSGGSSAEQGSFTLSKR